MPDSNSMSTIFFFTREPKNNEQLLFHPTCFLPSHDHWKTINIKINTNENTVLWHYQMLKH